ncbi:MAG: type 1 periplasmic binding fold superfamily protein [Bacteroidota bacterium]
MTATNQLFIGLMLLLPLVFMACDDERVDPQTEELITNLTLTLAPAGAGAPIVLSFTDVDGEGGAEGVFSTTPLMANTTYAGSVTLLNTADGATADITRDIEADEESYQLFYQAMMGLNLTAGYEDADANNNPIGLLTTITTGEASTGTLKVTLRSQLTKNAAGVSDGDISNAGGDTDFEVVFEVEIQ